MEAFEVSRTGNIIQIVFDAQHFKEDAIIRLLNRLYIEYLAERASLGEDIEVLGEEIKRDWWIQNKARILDKIHAQNGHN